jgi:hypothetical protein
MVESSYRTSGLEQYFLPELPAWANASSAGRCLKKHSYQYLDFNKLSSAYGFNYLDLLEFQAQYNERVENYYRSAAVKFLKPVEESSFFSSTLENVRSGVRSFKLPPMVKKVDLIWFDQFHIENQVSELKKMNEQGQFEERLPVLFSGCFSKNDLNQWLMENQLDDVGFYLLTAEWLSPFGSDLEIKTGLHIEIKKIIGDETDVRFVSPTKILLPTEIIL